MALDGDLVKSFLAKAERKVIICAPFIKKDALEGIMASVKEEVEVTIYTRWRPHEIALGVSDLEVFDVVATRSKAGLYLIDNLHAKLFSSDDAVLVGSANVTNSALGWSRAPNVELVVPSSWSDPSVARLMAHFLSATKATLKMKDKLEKAALELKLEQVLSEIEEQNLSKGEYGYWLPACSVPQILYSVYAAGDPGKRYTAGAVEDARSDIGALGIPAGLAEGDFRRYVKGVLLKSPCFSRLVQEIPRKLTEEKALEVLGLFRPGSDILTTKLHWQNVLQWIAVFMNDDFEIAAVSYEVRLK